jgi:hypothetical protein
MRQREEVQEMLRRVFLISSAILLSLLAGVSFAAVWPEKFGEFTKSSEKTVTTAATDEAVWDEYGLKEVRLAEYTSGKARFRAFAYRFSAPTGALAAFQWQSPPDGRPSAVGEYAVETPDSLLLLYGNYLFRFEKRKPTVEELRPVLENLPLLDQSALPALSSALPEENLIPNSQRFVSGPVSLERVEPRIPPAVAAFHYGAEAQFGKYRSGSGQMQLGIFSYPTPQIARERLAEFQKLPGAVVKRSGPLLAVIFSPHDANEAERLLAKVRYQATVTWGEPVGGKQNGLGSVIITSIFFALILFGFGIVVGLAFGGVRVLSRLWFGSEHTEEPMILLNLRDR